LSAEAQQPKKVPRIGYLSSSDPATESTRAEAIRLALRKLGYIEGQNIAIEYRYTEGKPGRNQELIAELVRLKVDIILVTGGAPAIRAAKNATKAIPIVMIGTGSDPVEAGLVESLARPGGNVTGITNLTIELGGKRLDAGMAEAGYVEGKNLQINIPNVKTYDELRPIAKRYVEEKVDVIVTNGAYWGAGAGESAEFMTAGE